MLPDDAVANAAVLLEIDGFPVTTFADLDQWFKSLVQQIANIADTHTRQFLSAEMLSQYQQYHSVLTGLRGAYDGVKQPIAKPRLMLVK